MKLIDLKVIDFLNEVDSSKPAPGGGSVSALTIVQGISLLRMVAHLTVSKKKFLGLDEETKSDYQKRMDDLLEIKNKVLVCVDKDTEAFNKIMEAFKLPKNTEEEISLRTKTIDNATIEATKVPFDVASLGYKALETALPMFANANKNATSDFGVGVLLINAGLIGAVLNVRTNMATFENREIASQFLNETQILEVKSKQIVESVLKMVNETFK